MTKKLSPGLVKQITYFFEDHPAQELNQNLRRILLDYLRVELRSNVPLFTEELLCACYDLFDLLDEVAIETNQWHKKQLQDTT